MNILTILRSDYIPNQYYIGIPSHYYYPMPKINYAILVLLLAMLVQACVDPNCEKCNQDINICDNCNVLFNRYSNGRCCSITLVAECVDCNPTGNTCTRCL